MKTKALIIGMVSFIFLITTSGIASAQSAGNTDTKNGAKKEKMQAMKVAYISDKISLTASEAEKFWPVYNEYQDKKTAFQKENRSKMKALKETKPENLTEEQAEEIINAELAQEQNLLDLKKEYFPKFKKIIGSKKVVGLYMAEKEFNKLLLERLKDGKQKPVSE
ncbi:MAG: hypothetical protein WCQ95_07475 [Bacteroidota bacterium]